MVVGGRSKRAEAFVDGDSKKKATPFCHWEQGGFVTSDKAQFYFQRERRVRSVEWNLLRKPRPVRKATRLVVYRRCTDRYSVGRQRATRDRTPWFAANDIRTCLLSGRGGATEVAAISETFLGERKRSARGNERCTPFLNLN